MNIMRKFLQGSLSQGHYNPCSKNYHNISIKTHCDEKRTNFLSFKLKFDMLIFKKINIPSRQTIILNLLFSITISMTQESNYINEIINIKDLLRKSRHSIIV